MVLYPARLFLERLPLFANHTLETLISKMSEDVQSSIERVMMGPTISLHKMFNTVKKVLSLIPSVRLNRMGFQFILRKMDWAVSLNTELRPVSQ